MPLFGLEDRATHYPPACAKFEVGRLVPHLGGTLLPALRDNRPQTPCPDSGTNLYKFASGRGRPAERTGRRAPVLPAEE